MTTVPIIGGKTCRSCEHRRLESQVVFCYRFPPHVVVVPMPGPNGQVVPGFQSAYPQVNPILTCGEYRRKEEFARDEIRAASTEAAGALRQ